MSIPRSCCTLVLSLLVSFSPVPCSAAALPAIDATIYTKQGELPLKLEMAVTPAAREQGLMARDSLRPNDGMVFVFPVEDDYGFWMKDTRIPLDMLFIDGGNTVVYIEHSAKPYSLKERQPHSKVGAVIELDGGRASREGIAVGDKVRYVLPEGTMVE